MNVDHYIISNHTRAIISTNHYKYRSLILEPEKEIHCKSTPQQIMEESCIYFGSSYHGRRKASEDILQTNKKPPVSISHHHKIYMIPTGSLRSKHCVWVAYYQIEQYESRNNQTIVTFRDKTTLPLDISRKSFHEQFKRTSVVIAQLEYKWMKQTLSI